MTDLDGHLDGPLDGLLARLNAAATRPPEQHTADLDALTDTTRRLHEWAATEHEGHDETGLVTATVDGRGELLRLAISDLTVRRLTAPQLGDACRQALTAALTAAADQAAALADQLDLPRRLDTGRIHGALHDVAALLAAGPPAVGQRRAELAGRVTATLDRLDHLEQAPSASYEATSEDGAVTATADAAGTVTAITVRADAKRDLDNLTLADTIRDTVTAARHHAYDQARDQAGGVATSPDGRP